MMLLARFRTGLVGNPVALHPRVRCPFPLPQDDQTPAPNSDYE